MSDFKGHIEQWYKESEPDYYLLFLKVWIPFNAWYVVELPQFKKKDTDIIKELQENENSKPRRIIENYLTQNSFEAIKFQGHLAELCNQLEKKVVIHNGHRLSFKNIPFIEDSQTFDKLVDVNENVYKVEKTGSYFQALIQAKNGKTLLDCKMPSFNLNALKTNMDFIRLNNETIQENIINLFAILDPFKPTNLISSSSNPSEYIELSYSEKIKLKNKPGLISKSCIHILYALRCMLFHGEIEPNNANKPIYEHASHLLRLILQNLR